MSARRAIGRRLMRMYERLYAYFGPQGWWPGEGPFDVIVGAILTQNTAWKNVEKAILALKVAGVLSPEGLRSIPEPELAKFVASARFFNQKARSLKAMLGFLDDEFGGDLEALLAAPWDLLRERLLRVRGVGRETADSILLYAAGRPVFVVDAYTKRILSRHGMIAEKASYEDVRRLLEENLPRDVRLYEEFHALLVRTGNAFCRKRPRCGNCPLGPMLPRGRGA